jgi:hypothetical protein
VFKMCSACPRSSLSGHAVAVRDDLRLAVSPLRREVLTSACLGPIEACDLNAGVSPQVH